MAAPASNIDFAALTHVIHFFPAVPNLDGTTLNSTDNSISVSNSASASFHSPMRPVERRSCCAGGANTESLFQSAASSTNLPAFMHNLTNFMASRGYDGVVIDWEPLPSTDAALFYQSGERAAFRSEYFFTAFAPDRGRRCLSAFRRFCLGGVCHVRPNPRSV